MHIAKQCVDVFKLVSSLRRFSFRLLICNINVFFLDDSKKNKTPVRSERSQVLKHGGSKQSTVIYIIVFPFQPD